MRNQQNPETEPEEVPEEDIVAIAYYLLISNARVAEPYGRLHYAKCKVEAVCADHLDEEAEDMWG